MASDWVIDVDLESKLCFPVHILATSERPDIVIYSDSLKIVILIELTCPAEENFESSRTYKLDRYGNLVSLVELNGWKCHHFPVEVGARGYYARSLFGCLRKLGFPSKQVTEICKTLARSAMESSFQIWLARDNRDWTPETVEQPSSRIPLCSSGKGASRVQANDSFGHCPPTQSGSVQCRQPVGLKNLGRTCYVNAIMQCLLSFSEFWLRAGLVHQRHSQFLKPLIAALTLMKNGSKTIDLSFLLPHLASLLSSKLGHRVEANDWHDAAEVLNFILDEVQDTTGIYSSARVEICNQSTCVSCLLESESRELVNMVILPVQDSLLRCLNDFYTPQPVAGTSSCGACGSSESFSSERFFCNLPNILILQIDRNISMGNGSFYDTRKVTFHEWLEVPESDGVVSVMIKFRLRAAINHSGSAKSGHNTAHVRRGDHWFFCNDSAVVRSRGPFNASSQKSIFFYERVSPKSVTQSI